MKLHVVNTIITTIILSIGGEAKILRNNALITKMVSNFQKDNTMSTEPESSDRRKPGKVMSSMQNVLCRNFPSIPCDIITNDKMLNRLIERSIQQINNKKMAIDRIAKSADSTLFPKINSEDLSNFLQEHSPRVLTKQKKKHKKVKTVKEMERKPQEYIKKISRREPKRTAVLGGRKKLRKFYPHRVKHKHRAGDGRSFRDDSEDKLSISVEAPDWPPDGNRPPLEYREEPDNSVWRIDYGKHGEPGLNVITYEERLRGKTGPNVIVDEPLRARKDVLHPDVYIKKSFVKKNSLDVHSDGVD